MSRRSRILRVSKFDSTVGCSAVTHMARFEHFATAAVAAGLAADLEGFNRFSFKPCPRPGEQSLGVRAEK